MSWVRTRDIKNGAVTAQKLASGAVSGASLSSGGVTTDKLGVLVANKTGGSIAAGQLVYVNGYDATLGAPTIALADADVAAARASWITSASIANNASGTVVKAYTLTGQNTNGRTVGDACYLSTTAGGYAFTAPVSNQAVVQVVGRVKVVNASTGQVAVDLSAEGTVYKWSSNDLQNSAVTLAALQTNVLQQVTTTITNAEFLALRATPKQLVPAPGAGQVVEFISAVLYQLNVGAYTETADNLGIKYTNGAGAQVSADIETTGFVDQTTAQYRNAIPQKDVAMVANAALVLHNTGDGEFGGGNAGNTTRVVCTYRIHVLP